MPGGPQPIEREQRMKLARETAVRAWGRLRGNAQDSFLKAVACAKIGTSKKVFHILHSKEGR